MRKIWGVAGLAALALSLSACASSGSSSAAAGNTPAAAASSPAASAPAGSAPAASSGGTTLTVKTIGSQQVVTNSQGFTLYWFAPDTATTSKCTGSCATYWPPVKGPASAMSGVTGKLGTITRSDGTTQATYDGHPALHLRRRLRPRAGQGQRGERLGRAVVRDDGLGSHPGG
jgi:predicted lipoprotein with Yx(FWY)xxD motif